MEKEPFETRFSNIFIVQNFYLIENSTHPSEALGGREIEGGGKILQKIPSLVQK